ncbi:hypothetical protein ACP4OV_022066 [Aristida adscensionis]
MEQGRSESQENGVVNMTRAMEALSPLLHSPRGTIVQVEALVAAAAALLLLQLVLGACKRRWHSSFLKAGLSLCSALMFPLSLYTMSMMQSSPVKNSFYPVWGVLLIMASGGTSLVKQFDFHGGNTKAIQFIIELARQLFFWNILRILEGCLEFAFGYTHNGTEVAEWMKKHANDRGDDWDPRSMKGYNYLVKYPLRLFSNEAFSDDDETSKDVCLSFALFELLKRRYYGLVCAEASLPKTQDFVFKGLLPSENDYKRAFKIVEVSLETLKPIIQVNTTKVDYIITLVVIGASDDLFGDDPEDPDYEEELVGFEGEVVPHISDCSKFWSLAKRGPVQVSDTVKKAIARSLLSTTGKLTNGETSLKQNQVFCWTLEGHSQVELMLIWHVATDYCHLSQSDDQSNGGVAVDLSRYCAYLIADVPELLPYHVADTNFSKSTVVEEAREVLASSNLSERFEIMKNLQGTEEADDPETVFKKGVKLGKQLERVLDEAQRWELMADFWAETIIYVAPSHTTAKQHMQRLETGGEFLTHLWALLSHADILNLDRDKDQGAKLAQSTAETA